MFEWGNETNPGAALYMGEDGLTAGGELTVYSDQFNGQLLLHADRLRRTRDAEQSRGWPAARRARSWSSTRLARD